MPVDAFLRGLAEAVPQVPWVSDLESLRGSAGGVFGGGEGAVAADDLDAGSLRRPLCQAAGLAIRHQVHGVSGLDVDEHGVDTSGFLPILRSAKIAGGVGSSVTGLAGPRIFGELRSPAEEAGPTAHAPNSPAAAQMARQESMVLMESYRGHFARCLCLYCRFGVASFLAGTCDRIEGGVHFLGRGLPMNVFQPCM